MSLVTTTILSGIAGLALGAGGMRFLWKRAVESGGEPPKWLPKPLTNACFGKELADHLAKSKRAIIENEQLRKEVRALSSLLNLAPFPVWRRDKNLTIQYCNLTYTSMLEDVADHVLEEYGLELSQYAQKQAAKALEAREASIQKRHMIVEGQRRLYQVTEIPDLDSGGTVGFAIDITALEDAEEETRRQISAQKDLLEASNMATAIFGADKKLNYYNSAFVNLWKLDESWLDKEPSYAEMLELLREKRRIPEMVNFLQFKEQRQKLFTDLMETREEIAHLPDGRILRVLIIPHALGGLIFSYEDVTDRMALESSYNTLIAVQRETLNNLHEGLAVFGEDGRLRLSNPVYQRLWGLSPSFISTEPHIGEILEETKGFYTFTDWEEFKQRMITQLHVRKMNYQRIERTDGSVIDWSTVPLPDGATLITYFDVTDSTLVERSLIDKNEALRSADSLKTEFLLSVSYELRSPLTSITGFAEILKHRYFGDLNERQDEYVNAIHESATQLGQLINNILDLASIEAGYMRLEISECDIVSLMDEVFSLHQERAKSNQVELTLDCPKDIGVLEVDEARIKQVLFNLLTNALKYTPADGKVKLSVTRGEDDNVVLTVEDNGMGIPEEEQRSVFERFRAGAIRTQRSGAGLGLAMVKNFIELHGGRVELISDQGQGTRVSCYVPRSNPGVYNASTMGQSGSPLAAAYKAEKSLSQEGDD